MCVEWRATSEGDISEWDSAWNSLTIAFMSYEAESCTEDILPDVNNIPNIIAGGCFDGTQLTEAVNIPGFCSCPATRAIGTFYDSVASIAGLNCGGTLLEAFASVNAACVENMPEGSPGAADKSLSIVVAMDDTEAFTERQKVEIGWEMVQIMFNELFLKPLDSIDVVSSFTGTQKKIRLTFTLLQWENATPELAAAALDNQTQKEGFAAGLTGAFGGTFVSAHLEDESGTIIIAPDSLG